MLVLRDTDEQDIVVTCPVCGQALYRERSVAEVDEHSCQSLYTFHDIAGSGHCVVGAGTCDQCRGGKERCAMIECQ